MHAPWCTSKDPHPQPGKMLHRRPSNYLQVNAWLSTKCPCPCVISHPAHTWTYRSTAIHGHRDTGACRCVPTHLSQHSWVSYLGPAPRWPSSCQRNADIWGCSASGREGEAEGKPHGQESRQECQGKAGLSSARNCAGGGARADTCSSLTCHPVSLELLGLGVHRGSEIISPHWKQITESL